MKYLTSLKNILKNGKILKLIISFLILIFLFKFINFQLLLNSIKNINYFIFFALALIPICVLLRAIRWMIIINKDKRLIFVKDSYSLTLVGIALNIFLPASFGDVAKSYYGYRWHGVKEEMLSSSILDKFIALLSVFILGCIMAFLFKLYILSFVSFSVSFLISIIIFFPDKIPWDQLNRLLNKITGINLDSKKLRSSFKISNRIKFITLFISIIAWVITYLQLFFVCKSFSLDISFIYILAVAPLITSAVLFPFTFNGIGSGEAVMVYLFSLVNIPPTLAIIVSLMYSQILTTIIPGLFGLAIILKNK